MARYPRLMPTHPQLLRARVVRSVRRSPSFQRVTIGGPELAGFSYAGFDHWFRLFLPPRPGAPLVLPQVRGRVWWQPYLDIPEDRRPHCSNYTVVDVRRRGEHTELDIDVVLHWDEGTGELAGPVASWAASTAPGSELAILDQGPLFDPPADATAVHLAADETGLPGLRGILRDLPEHTRGTAIVEVPHVDDVEDLAAPGGMRVSWVTRTVEGPGAAALARLRAAVVNGGAPAPQDYGFVVGEAALATGGRRALRAAGLPAARITFSGFWKHRLH